MSFRSTSGVPSITSTYIPTFDGLRAIAALIVLCGHTRERLELSYVDVHEMGGIWSLFVSTQIGVDLFFVLSGFLITSILLEIRRRGGSMLSFWLRRVLRLSPLHLFYTTLLIFVVHVIGGPFAPLQSITPLEWVGFLAYMGNIVLAFAEPVRLEVSVLWSLAVEEQFYLIWPIIIHKMDSVIELAKFAAMCIVLAAGLRWILAAYATQSDAFYVLTITRMDSLMCGGLMAIGRMYWSGWARFRALVARWGWLPALIAIGYILYTPFYHEVPQPSWRIGIYYTCVAVAWAIIILRAVEGGRLTNLLLANRPIRFLGKISYGLYVWHSAIIAIVLMWIDGLEVSAQDELVLATTAVIAGTVVISTVSYYALERPFLKLKKYFPYFGEAEAKS